MKKSEEIEFGEKTLKIKRRKKFKSEVEREEPKQMKKPKRRRS